MGKIIYSKNGETTVCTYSHMTINGSTYVNNTGSGISHISNVGNVNVGCGPFWDGKDLNNCLSGPANWCEKQWKDWASPSKSMGETVKKIALFVPLLLSTVGASFLKCIGLFSFCPSNGEEITASSPIKTIVGSQRFIEKTLLLNEDLIDSVKFLGSVGPLLIVRGEANSLKIQGEDNLLDFFSLYRLQDHQLTIGQIAPDLMMKLHGAIHYTLTVASPLEELIVSNGGKVFIPSLNTSKFSCDIQGSGKVMIQEGEATNQVVNISGSGKYRADHLTTEHSEVKISGSGSARVKAISSLSVNLLGTGRCIYSGNPKVTSRGSGKVFRNVM